MKENIIPIIFFVILSVVVIVMVIGIIGQMFLVNEECKRIYPEKELIKSEYSGFLDRGYCKFLENENKVSTQKLDCIGFLFDFKCYKRS